MSNLEKVKIQISRDETNDIDHGESNGTCHCLRPLPILLVCDPRLDLGPPDL
jgi:hypothetical protein